MQPAADNKAPIAAALAELLPWLWQSGRAVPDDVQMRAQRLWLDTASCAWSGLRADEPRRWLALQAHGERGDVMLPGTALRYGTGTAAAAFALGACWDEACEGLALAHGRPGVPVVAALWTQLQALQPDWSALWQATAVGYEVGARLGACLRIRPGQHVDGMWSAFGAAVAVAHLRGHSWHMALSALEACAVQLPYSLYLPITQGANVRNLYLAHSAWLGVQAVLAVEAGMTAPAGAIDEFARLALADDSRGAWLPPGRWLVLDSYWKPYAGVRHVHYGAAAALRLREQVADPATIEALRLSVYAEAMVYCANRAPRSALVAQFSLSFGVAAALCFGELSPAEYRPPRFDDAQLRRLESLIELREDAVAFPAPQRGARLEARVRGQLLVVDQGPVVGDPGFEPDAAQLAAKYERYTQGDATMAAWALKLQHDPVSATARWPHTEAKD